MQAVGPKRLVTVQIIPSKIAGHSDAWAVRPKGHCAILPARTPVRLGGICHAHNRPRYLLAGVHKIVEFFVPIILKRIPASPAGVLLWKYHFRPGADFLKSLSSFCRSILRMGSRSRCVRSVCVYSKRIACGRRPRAAFQSNSRLKKNFERQIHHGNAAIGHRGSLISRRHLAE